MNDPANVCSAVKAAIDGLGGLDILVVNTPGHSDATFAARASDDRLTCAQHHYTINTLAPVAAYQASRDALKVPPSHFSRCVLDAICCQLCLSALVPTASVFHTHTCNCRLLEARWCASAQ